MLLFLFIYFFRKSNSEETLLNDILPQISKIYDSGDKFLVFQKILPLIDKYPDNDMINDFLNKASWKVSVDTDLPNTKVYIKYGFDFLYKYRGFSALGEFVSTNANVPDGIYERVRNDGSTSTEFIVNGEPVDVKDYVKNRIHRHR